MKIYYEEGPPLVRFGPHELRIGEPVEIPDEAAREIIRKGRAKKWEEKSVERAEHGAKRKGN